MNLYTDNSIYKNTQSLEFKKIEDYKHKSEYHFHSQFEIVCCLKGTATIDCIFESIKLCEGECIIIPPYKIHLTEFNGFSGISLIFKKSYIDENYQNGIAENFILPFINNHFYKLTDTNAFETIDSILKNIIKPEFGHSFLHIADLLMMFKENGEIFLPVSKAKNVLLQKIINYINENISDDLSIASIANKFAVTEFYVCRIFKKELNITAVTYITNLRISVACNLLVNTNTDIKKISKISGFKSHTYFHNIFKENFNMTPAKYRLERK